MDSVEHPSLTHREFYAVTPGEETVFEQGDAYEGFMGRWSRRLAPLLVELASVKDGNSLLDVGSGIGALTFCLAETLPRANITGVELSPGFVRHAHARRPDDRVRFVNGDAQALPFANASFDGTLALVVINFIPDPAAAVREMVRVTRPGGSIAAAVWDYGGRMEMLRVFWEEAMALDPCVAGRDERDMPLGKRGQLAELWRGNGIHHVEERPLIIDLPFRSFDDYWLPFLGGQGPAGAYLTSLAGAARSELASRLRTRLLGTNEDGPFTLKARAWAVTGIVRRRSNKALTAQP